MSKIRGRKEAGYNRELKAKRNRGLNERQASLSPRGALEQTSIIVKVSLISFCPGKVALAWVRAILWRTGA